MRPRPVFLTALANPSVARDVAAQPGLPTALVAVSSPTVDGRNWGVARAYADLQPMTTNGLAGLFTFIGPTTVYAHGTLADLWLINADGSDLRQVSSLRAHDPALAWAPDGSQLFAFGNWGGVLIDLRSGENTLMTYLTGTAAVAWPP